jgi:hypothetical protein
MRQIGFMPHWAADRCELGAVLARGDDLAGSLGVHRGGMRWVAVRLADAFLRTVGPGPESEAPGLHRYWSDPRSPYRSGPHGAVGRADGRLAGWACLFAAPRCRVDAFIIDGRIVADEGATTRSELPQAVRRTRLAVSHVEPPVGRMSWGAWRLSLGKNALADD